jgi:hypothetical protein
MYYYFAFLDTSNLPKAQANQGSISAVLTIVFAVAGSLALLMIVIGGFRYITAQGNPNDVARARGTIIYSVIGLLVAMAAYSIVAFVVKGV